jgi:hypothetical protein
VEFAHECKSRQHYRYSYNISHCEKWNDVTVVCPAPRRPRKMERRVRITSLAVDSVFSVSSHFWQSRAKQNVGCTEQSSDGERIGPVPG